MKPRTSPKKKAQPPAAHPGSQGRPFASCSSLPLPLLRPDWGNNLHRMGSLLSFSPLGTLHFDYQLISLSSPATLLRAPTLWCGGLHRWISAVFGCGKPAESKNPMKTLGLLSWLGGWRIVASSTSSSTMAGERNEPTCLLAGHLEASSPITCSFVLRLYKWDRMIERNCRLIQVYRALNM